MDTQKVAAEYRLSEVVPIAVEIEVAVPGPVMA